MKENPIYRNIQHDPRIIGISYKSLIGTMGILLVSLMILTKFLGLVGGLAAGLASTIGFYLFSFWNDNRDQVEIDGKKSPLKRIIAAPVLGNQQLKIR